jgi:hypothetical protein
MGDPVFETREALEAWVEAECDAVNQRAFEICPIEAAKIGNRIRRVVASHEKLRGDK